MRLAIGLSYVMLVGLWGLTVWLGNMWVAAALHLLSRTAYIGFAGVTLHREEHYRAWTRRWGPEGAYARFKPICTLLQNNDGVTLVLLCVLSYQTIVTPLPVWLHWALGALLIAGGIAAKASATMSLGAGAYSWEDFFIEPGTKEPTMRGLYRWLSHPMYTMGYLHNYGFAFALQSWIGILGAAYDHLAMLVFHMLVEKPHCDRLFGGGSVDVRLRESD